MLPAFWFLLTLQAKNNYLWLDRYTHKRFSQMFIFYRRETVLGQKC